jgi:hypothetical protein
MSLALMVGGRPAGAQGRPDSAECTQRLSGPTLDSVIVELRLRVVPFDSTRHLAASYGGMIGQGIRQFLVLPHVLPADVWDGRLGEPTMPIVDGAYRAFLHRNGRLTEVRVVGGTRDPAFDGAMLNAIATLDTSLLLPPLDARTLDHGDSVDIRLSVDDDPVAAVGMPLRTFPLDSNVTRLARMRLPLRHVTRPVTPSPDNRSPVFPWDMRFLGYRGAANIAFVVGRDSVPDLRTAEVLSATHGRFAQAALEALADYRYSPLEVEGCKVASWVVQYFEFKFN